MAYDPKILAEVIEFSSAQAHAAQVAKVNMNAVAKPKKRSFSIDGHYLTGSSGGLVRQSMNYSADNISQALSMAEKHGLIARISSVENPSYQASRSSSFTPLSELKSVFQKIV